jgi:hypothetical protein
MPWARHGQVPAGFIAPPRRKRYYASRLKTQSLGSIFPEEVAVADISADRIHAAMTGLVHNGAFGFAGRGGGSGEAGAQAVAGKLTRIKSQPLDVTLDDDAHAFAGKAFRQNLVMPVHDTKNRSRLDVGRSAPGVQSPERTAGLVGPGRNADPSSLPFLIRCRAAL